MEYRRYISAEFVRALNDLYDNEPMGWWRKLLADPDIYLAFRSEAINAYYKGCSLAQIVFSGGEVGVLTHYKYLLKPVLSSPMILARGGVYQFPSGWSEGAGGPFIETLSDPPPEKWTGLGRSALGFSWADVAQS